MDPAAIAYYEQNPIVAEGNIRVTIIDEQKGKGVCTTRPLQTGDILFTEFPLLSLQHRKNARYFQCCEFCLRSIGTIGEQWRRMLIEHRNKKRRRKQRQQEPQIVHKSTAHVSGDDDDDDDDEEEDDDADDEVDEKADSKTNSVYDDDDKTDDDASLYPIPDPLPFTFNSKTTPLVPSALTAALASSPTTAASAKPSAPPLFDLARYDVTPVPCSAGCDELYCSESCRSRAWEQYHQIICPRTSFKQQSKASEQQHPIALYYEHADNTNEIFILVLKMIATIISSSSSSTTDTPASFFPFSLFTSSIWWEQVAIPPSLSPASALRFRASLQQLCIDTLVLLTQIFPLHIHDERYTWLFTVDMIGRMVTIFEMNQLAIFAPSPLSTYIAFYHTLSIEQQTAFKAALPAPIFAHTAAIASLRIEGMALFTIACCINHSCCPSLSLVKRDNVHEHEGFMDLDASMSLMCVETVIEDDEVSISYIDEDIEDVDERASLLIEYGFVCQCERCVRERAVKHGDNIEDEDDGGNDDDDADSALDKFEDDDNEDNEEDDADEEAEDDDEA